MGKRKAISLVQILATLWTATVVSVLFMASRTTVSPRAKFVLMETGKDSGKWTKDSLIGGSKMWMPAVGGGAPKVKSLSAAWSRESADNFYDHLEVHS